MSTKRKRSVLSIKDKQIIISRLDKGEKGTNLAPDEEDDGQEEKQVSNSEAAECFKKGLSWMEGQNRVLTLFKLCNFAV